jgi:hypothetical protein
VAGEHAFYFKDKETLTSLLMLLDRQDKRLNESGRDWILSRYSWKQSADLLKKAVEHI